MKSGRYRFGLFEFDTETLELRRQGAVIHFQSQPARVLACLIQNADRAVSREELRKAIWGNETFVDFERGLNFCISQLRSALEDDPARPIYIRTFPKHGYQFIAPVKLIAQDPSLQHNGAEVPSPQGVSRLVNRRGLWAGFAVLVLGIAIFGAAYWLRRHPDLKQPPIVAVVRFDNETGNPEVTRFSDALTDNVVERLSTLSNGRYAVIGNARILRLPREQRDLNAVGAALHAKYIVFGQVQSNGSQTRILAHLIRIPDLTHLRVARMDRILTDPLSLESEMAQEIANQFSTHVATDALRTISPPAGMH